MVLAAASFSLIALTGAGAAGSISTLTRRSGGAGGGGGRRRLLLGLCGGETGGYRQRCRDQRFHADSPRSREMIGIFAGEGNRPVVAWNVRPRAVLNRRKMRGHPGIIISRRVTVLVRARSGDESRARLEGHVRPQPVEHHDQPVPETDQERDG